jgi:hypothetical protein
VCMLVTCLEGSPASTVRVPLPPTLSLRLPRVLVGLCRCFCQSGITDNDRGNRSAGVHEFP